jgi:RNA polymerase sigma-70 factor (ECF subfamily)
LQEERNAAATPDIGLLIDGAISGDADDFGRLYDLHVERVYRHMYYRVGNNTDAEDLTQQVFLKAWKAIGKYKKTSSPFLAWLMKISHNLVVDFYRSKKDAVFLDDELPVQDKAPGPEQLAEERYDQEQLRKVILRLPPKQQQVIMMSFIEGFSYGEIADALGKREGNVRVTVHRALKKMRQILETEKQLS